jgi:hypothetical protein
LAAGDDMIFNLPNEFWASKNINRTKIKRRNNPTKMATIANFFLMSGLSILADPINYCKAPQVHDFPTKSGLYDIITA